MALYEMQEMSLPNEEGKRILYPRIRLTGQLTLEEVAERISRASTFTPGDVKGLITALIETIAGGMAGGQSVKIDGLGVFTPALGLRKGRERETGEAGDTRRNATSIYLSHIHFKPDRQFLHKTGERCRLERSELKFRRSSTRYTPEERLAIAQTYLAKHALMTVADYCRLTGLLPSSAAMELRKWRDLEGSGISTKGRGSHKVYVREEV